MTARFGKVAVLMGGWSAERPISLLSGAAVLAGLRARGVDAHGVDVDRARVLGLKAEGFDCVWNALHGPGGEDGTVPAALELQGLPYTGSGVLASALAMDKARCKAIWMAAGLPTPAFRMLHADTDFDRVANDLGLPLFVKPAHEGSSIGMSRVDQANQLSAAWREAAKYDAEVLAEQFIEGGEYTAAVLGDTVLPLIQIEAATGFYDYHAKYQAGDTQYHCPCGLPQAQASRLSALSLDAFRAAGGAGWGRVDFMLDRQGQPWFLELNTIPGMTAHSLVPLAAHAAGIEFDALVVQVLEIAVEGHHALG